MFSKPRFGWTAWSINNHDIGSVSYLSDVPAEFISACIRYLNNPVGFNLIFDGEGRNTALTLIGNYFCTYSFMGSEPPYISELTPVSDYILPETDDGPKFIESLLREAISDFERDFSEWAEWNPGLYEGEDEIEAEKGILRDLIETGKDILNKKPYCKPELGNLLFGNSRGEYPVSRDIGDIFFEFLGDSFDAYGFFDDKTKATELGGYENDVFVVNPYYWGDDGEIAKLPNFIYKPNNIEISWYKYPMRDAYSNTPITKGLASEIFKHCKESL